MSGEPLRQLSIQVARFKLITDSAQLEECILTMNVSKLGGEDGIDVLHGMVSKLMEQRSEFVAYQVCGDAVCRSSACSWQCLTPTASAPVSPSHLPRLFLTHSLTYRAVVGLFAAQTYVGPTDTLPRPQQFLVVLAQLPRVIGKLTCMLTLGQLAPDIDAAVRQVACFAKGVDEVRRGAAVVAPAV